MGRRESVGKEGLDGGKTQVVSLAEVAGKIAWDGELEVAVVGLSLIAAPLTTTLTLFAVLRKFLVERRVVVLELVLVVLHQPQQGAELGGDALQGRKLSQVSDLNFSDPPEGLVFSGG